MYKELSDYLISKGVSKENQHWKKYESFDFNKLESLTFVNVERKDLNGDDVILFETQDSVFAMYHEQDCCEWVTIESIIGDLRDLVGTPILLSDEVIDSGDSEDGTYTWTFYKLGTIKGYVDIRWNGESNGYYSESVNFIKLKKG